jgi:hypothetical protein
MIIGREIGRDHGEIWLATRQRVRGLLAGSTPADMSRPVPAMPGLTVRDVLSGLVATAADALDGDIHATYGTPDGGRAPDARTDAELLSAWDAQAAGVAALVRDDPRAAPHRPGHARARPARGAGLPRSARRRRGGDRGRAARQGVRRALARR